MQLLQLENVGKSYGSRTIFRGITTAVASGEHLAVVGPNGSGKSTLLRIAAGLLRPTSGSVSLRDATGRTVPGEYHSRSLGYMAPYVSFYKTLSARENLRFLALLRSDVPPARVDETLDRVRLLDRADDAVGSFSSGMLQRLRVASAIIHRPMVLLMDEPFANLDTPGAELVTSVVEEYVAAGGAVIVATNRPDIADRSSRVLSVPDFAA